MLVGAMVALFSGAASVHAKMLTQKVTNFDVKTILGESDVWINGKKYKDYRIVATDVVITGDKNQDQIGKLLVRRGIRPDFNAFGYVFDLNPGLANINQLSQKQTITLPKVEWNNAALGKHPDYPVLAIMPGRKDRLAYTKNLEQIAFVSKQLRAAPRPDMFTTVNQAAWQKAVADFSVGSAELKKQDKPVSGVINRQIANLSKYVLDIHSAAYKGKYSPTDKDFSLVQFMSEGVKRLNQDLKKGKSGFSILRVTTVDGSGKEVSDYAVYYGPAGFPNEESRHNRFGKLSSPTEAIIANAFNYIVYAKKAGTIRSDKVNVSFEQLRAENPFILELPVH
jgi:hypothetical protein